MSYSDMRINPSLLGLIATSLVGPILAPDLAKLPLGLPVQVGELPYHAAIYMHSYMIICGGSVLNERHILCAAYCVVGDKDMPGRLNAVTGTVHRYRGGQWYNIQAISVHPMYAGDGGYDIAILKTVLSIELTEYTQPVKLPRADDAEITDGVFALVSGWGSATPDEPDQGDEVMFLQKMEVELLSLSTCQDLLAGTGREISTEQLCAGGLYAQGSCVVDNGSPLVLNEMQIGILSWGTPCGSGDPDVYTNVKAFLPWIHNTAFGSYKM